MKFINGIPDCHAHAKKTAIRTQRNCQKALPICTIRTVNASAPGDGGSHSRLQAPLHQWKSLLAAQGLAKRLPHSRGIVPFLRLTAEARGLLPGVHCHAHAKKTAIQTQRNCQKGCPLAPHALSVTLHWAMAARTRSSKPRCINGSLSLQHRAWQRDFRIPVELRHSSALLPRPEASFLAYTAMPTPRKQPYRPNVTVKSVTHLHHTHSQ